LQRDTARVDHLAREIDDLEGAGAGEGLPVLLLTEPDGKPDCQRALGVSRGIKQESKEPGTDLVVVSARPRALPRTSLGGRRGLVGLHEAAARRKRDERLKRRGRAAPACG